MRARRAHPTPGPLARRPCLPTRSCEGCSALRELPPALAGVLPLSCLNLLHSGVTRLPLAAGWCHPGKPGTRGGGATGSSARHSGSGGQRSGTISTAPLPGSGYLSHLTELRWGAADWEAARGGPAVRRWTGAAAAAVEGPDLSPVAQATGLRVLQLAHVPAGAEAQLAELRRQLPLLARLQVNSAVLLG